MYPGCNNRTFYNTLYFIQPIANYLKHEKVNANITFSHPKINTKDIFYSYEDIRNAILIDVEKI